jgi:hypothetical protein
VLEGKICYEQREWGPALYYVDELVNTVHALETRAYIRDNEAFLELASQITQLRNELELRTPWRPSGSEKLPQELQTYLQACKLRIDLLQYWSSYAENPGAGLFFPLPPLPPCPKYGASGH